MSSIWIARDKSGELIAFSKKPHRSCDEMWETDSSSGFSTIYDEWFPELKWEDEPIELVPKIMVDENTSLDECINTTFKGKEE